MRRTIIIISCLIVLVIFSIYLIKIIPETIQSRVPGQVYIVSLGDSVAAGAGLPDNGNLGVTDCDLSQDAFPFLIGKDLNKNVEQFACSGATVSYGSNSIESQYNMAKPYINNSDVIIYAGANDIGWLQTLISCSQTDCATSQNKILIAKKVAVMQKNLSGLLNQIQEYKPHSLLVNTYYQLLANNNNCFSGNGITNQEVTFINNEEALLNNAISAAATQSKATVVNIDFSDHLICDKQSWIQNLSDNAPIHPTALGQKQIAEQDTQALLQN